MIFRSLLQGGRTIVIADFEITGRRCSATSSARRTTAHAGEAAHHHLRALRHHRGREARGEGVGRARARARSTSSRSHGGGDRRGPAGHRAVRQHGRRHRRRHRPRSPSSRSPASSTRSRSASAATRWTRRSSVREAQVQPAHRRADGRAHQEGTIGNAARATIETMEVKGRDLVAGVPKTVVVNSTRIRDAPPSRSTQIVEAVKTALERRRRSSRADIVDKAGHSIGDHGTGSPAGTSRSPPRADRHTESSRPGRGDGT